MAEMNLLSQVAEHMPVVGSDGGHVGTVDKIEGERIKLTRNDPAAGGSHHYLPVSMIASIKDGTVHLDHHSVEVRGEWKS